MIGSPQVVLKLSSLVGCLQLGNNIMLVTFSCPNPLHSQNLQNHKAQTALYDIFYRLIEHS